VINRDPAMFTDPDTLLPGRPDARRHLAFGYGVHQCLGQNLARVEMQIAWPRLFERVPDLRLALAEDELPFKTNSIVYGLKSLPVTW
jgi:cytochrome P450